jgi:putative ABC transport system permease protein
LVIAGSLLGTAIITGSFIVGDTLDASITATATQQLGPVDEVVTFTTAQEAIEAATALRSSDAEIDGVIPIASARAALYTGGSDPKAEPGARLIEMDIEAATGFGGDPEQTGVEGTVPEEDEVFITEDVALALDVGVGDQITASLYGVEKQLDVRRIFPRKGLAGFWTGFETISPNAFVAPGTIDAALQQQGTSDDRTPPSYLLLVSNEGDVEAGADLTASVTDAIEEITGATNIDPVKKDRLDSAETQGDQFSEFFLAIGAFAVIAGILLLVQIFVMLAEERKSQLGMLRAVGLRRSDLVRSFYMQGGIYGLPAGIFGTLLGIGVGWAIVKVAAPIFGGFGDFSLDLTFALETSSLITGFSIGVVIALATVFLTSLRISRVNIIRAIRDLPEPTRTRARRRSMIAGGLVAMLGLMSLLSGLGDEQGWAGVIVGPGMIAYGSVPLLSRFFGTHRLLIAASIVSLAWGIFGNEITSGAFYDSGDIFAFVLVGLLLNIAAVILLTQGQDVIGALVHRFGARRLSLRLGLAYPLARRFRTGLTLAMFSLVIFTMVFISILSNVFSGQIDNTVKDEAGGFDILVDSLGTDPPSARALEGVDGVDRAATLYFGTAQFTTPSTSDPKPWTTSGVDETFVEIGPPNLTDDDLAEGLANDREAWTRLLEDDETAIVPTFFLNEGGGGPPTEYVQTGEQITIIDPVTGNSAQRRVIAMTDDDSAFSGVYMNSESLRDVMVLRSPRRVSTFPSRRMQTPNPSFAHCRVSSYETV